MNQNQTIFNQAMKTLLVCASVFLSNGLQADDAKIVSVEIERSSDEQQFRISVTLSHNDEGWDHYANRWDVLDETGKLLGSRTLAHPHVNEQPFTRSLSLMIPADVNTVTILASDSVHGDNPETFQLNVPKK